MSETDSETGSEDSYYWPALGSDATPAAPSPLENLVDGNAIPAAPSPLENLENVGSHVLLSHEADPAALIKLAEDVYNGLRVVRLPQLPPLDALLDGEGGAGGGAGSAPGAASTSAASIQRQDYAELAGMQAVQVVLDRRRGELTHCAEAGLFCLASGSREALRQLRFEGGRGIIAFDAAAYPQGAVVAFRGAVWSLLRGVEDAPPQYFLSLQPGQHVNVVSVCVLADLPLPGGYSGMGLRGAVSSLLPLHPGPTAPRSCTLGQQRCSAPWANGVAVRWRALVRAVRGPSEQARRCMQRRHDGAREPATHPMYVKDTAGKARTLGVALSWLVGDVMAELEVLTGDPFDAQRLTYAGGQLEADRTLAECNILKESTLHLVLRLGNL